jgi:hypothetical protein
MPPVVVIGDLWRVTTHTRRIGHEPAGNEPSAPDSQQPEDVTDAAICLIEYSAIVAVMPLSMTFIRH